MGINIVEQAHRERLVVSNSFGILRNCRYSTSNESNVRFPVQYVLRPDLNYRGYAGQVVSGVVSVGDKIKVFPSEKSQQSRISTPIPAS